MKTTFFTVALSIALLATILSASAQKSYTEGLEPSKQVQAARLLK